MGFYRSKSFLVSLLLLTAPAAAQMPEVSEKLQQDEHENQIPTSGHDGHFFIQSDDGSTRLQFDGLLHPRFVVSGVYSAEATETEPARPPERSGKFLLRRARLGLRGHLGGKKLGFRLLTEFGQGSAGLLDYYLNYAFHPQFQLRVGQDRKPFSRSLLTPAFQLQFIDRTFCEKNFAAGRDIGVLIHNGYLKAQGFEYALGLYNGTGANSTFDGSRFSNVPEQARPSTVVRVGYNFGNTQGYVGSDLREDGSPALALAVSSSTDFDANRSHDGKLQGDLDANFKAYGFSATAGAYVSTQQDGDAFTDRARPRWGAYGQMGYVAKRMVEPAVRVAWNKDRASQLDQIDATLGLNVFLQGQSLKWQTDGSVICDRLSAKATGFEARTQLQIAF